MQTKNILLYLFIIISLCSIASATTFRSADIEWGAEVSATLHRGDNLTNGNYTIKAAQFPYGVPGIKTLDGTKEKIVPETEVVPMVYLNIYKDKKFIQQIILNPDNKEYIDPDYEFKITVNNFIDKNATEWVLEYYDPWAEITLTTRGKPKPELVINTDKEKYTSFEDDIIEINIDVKNTGDAVLKDIDVNIDIGNLKLRGGGEDQLHQYYYKIEKGDAQNISIVLIVPGLYNERKYNITAEMVGYDVKHIKYKANASKTITITPKKEYFTISKSVSKDRIYLTETILVKVKLENGGMNKVYNIHVTDSMDSHFELKSESNFSWDIDVLEPGHEWETVYSIKPLETNLDGFYLPPATARYSSNGETYIITSKEPKVIVNGPKLVVNKTVNRSIVKVTQDVKVTITAINKGDIITPATITDTLPQGVSLVSGKTSLGPVTMELNEPQVFSYVIRVKTIGNITLPPAQISYKDVNYKGIRHASMFSKEINITVTDEKGKIPKFEEDSNISKENTSEVISNETKESNGSNEKSEKSEKSKTYISMKNKDKKNSVNKSPTPTPITPNIGILLSGLMVILAYILKKRG